MNRGLLNTFCFAMVTFILLTGNLWAVDNAFTSSAGNWNVSGNWSESIIPYTGDNYNQTIGNSAYPNKKAIVNTSVANIDGATYVGAQGATGTLELQSGGSLSSSSGFLVGYGSGGTGNMIVTGGSLTVTGTGWCRLGYNGDCIWNQSGGDVSLRYMNGWGYNGTVEINLSGGTLHIPNGIGPNANVDITISGTGEYLVGGDRTGDLTLGGIVSAASGWRLMGEYNNNITTIYAIYFNSPITITSPGTYSGNYASTSDTIAPITVQCSSGTVIIEDCILEACGNACIDIKPPAPDNVIVRYNKGYGFFSTNTGVLKPRFLFARYAKSLNIHNNYMEGTLGMRIYELSGDYSSSNSIQIHKNKVKNIDGRYSNSSSLYNASFIQFHTCKAGPNISVSYNHIENIPGSCHCGDLISCYLSSGTSSSNIAIANNLIDGVYHADEFVSSFSSAGVIVDGNPNGDSTKTPRYIKIYGNHVLDAGHVGISVSAGRDITVNNNRVWSSGRIDGTYYYYGWAGIMLDNHHSVSSDYFKDFDFHSNASTYAYARDFLTPVWRRHDYQWTDTPETEYNNYLIEPAGQEPTLSRKATEIQIFEDKCDTYSVSIGPDW